MKRHLFWIVELFIWLLILSLISSGIIFAKYTYKKKFDTYQIFLPDVDGLVNGSPVKLLGIQIGYVNQIDIVGEDVYVKFIVTQRNLKIPYGSVATVEFSGLGGSKSLELYPPSHNKNARDTLITPQSPKRISDSLGLLNEMYEQVVDVTYTVSSFMNKVGIIKSQNQAAKKGSSPKTASEVLDMSNCWIDKAQKQFDKWGKKLNGDKK